MAGETEEKPSGWTVDTLRAEIMGLFRETDKRYAERFAAQEKAIDKKTTEIESRFQSVNEFRQVLTDQTATFIPRTEATAQFKALDDKIESKTSALDDKIDGLEKRGERGVGHAAGLTAGWGYLVGAVGLVAVVIGVVIALVAV